MTRLSWTALFIGIAVVLGTATAVHASPVPDDAGSDCSWHEHGSTIEIGEETYTCHCAQLVGPMGPQVLCRWYRDDVLPSRKAKKRAAIKRPVAKLKAKPKPKLRVYPKPSVVA